MNNVTDVEYLSISTDRRVIDTIRNLTNKRIYKHKCPNKKEADWLLPSWINNVYKDNFVVITDYSYACGFINDDIGVDSLIPLSADLFLSIDDKKAKVIFKVLQINKPFPTYIESHVDWAVSSNSLMLTNEYGDIIFVSHTQVRNLRLEYLQAHNLIF